MAEDAVWKRDEVQSPCVKICVVHPEARICVGCLRTIEEIGSWSRMSAEDRQRIMQDLPSRTALIRKRRGGRARVAGKRGPS